MRDFTPHRPLSTRDGRAARFMGYANPPQRMGPYDYPIVAEIEHPSLGWVKWHYMLDGRWKSNDSSNHNDLVNVTVS